MRTQPQEIIAKLEADNSRLAKEEVIVEAMEEELDEFFRNSEEATFDEARNEFDEDEYNDEELRLYRIKFISDVAN